MEPVQHEHFGKIEHVTLNERPLRICLEQAASTKGVVGIKVELSGENSPATVEQAMSMFDKLRAQYPAPTDGGK